MIKSFFLDYLHNQEELKIGDDKLFDVQFTRETTNDYRKDNKLRMKLLNTTFKLRFVKILIDANGANTEEVLLTNLEQSEFDIIALKELYHLRWNIETAYNVLKNRMKLEEFSGYRNQLIRQDIYSCIWLYNIIMMYILEANEQDEIPQNRYKNHMKRNTNQAIGIVKSYFLKGLIDMNANQVSIVKQIIKCTLIPEKKDRKYERKTPVNKSRMSYKYTY